MQKHVLDYERHPPRRKHRRSGATQLWHSRRVVGLVVLLAFAALPTYALISAILNAYIAIGLLVFVTAGAPAWWYLRGRRQKVAVSGLAGLVLIGATVAHLTALTTIVVQNEGRQWISGLSFITESGRVVDAGPFAPERETTVRFRSLGFYGRITVFGTLQDGSQLSSSLSDLQRMARGESPSSEPAKFFRTRIHVRVTEEGQVEVRTRQRER